MLWASQVYHVVPPIASGCLVKRCHLSSPKETSDPYGCTRCDLKTCIQEGEENRVFVGDRTSGDVRGERDRPDGRRSRQEVCRGERFGSGFGC